MLDSRIPNIANPGSQTQDPRENCLGKENALIGALLSPVFSDGTEGEVHLDLCIWLVRGPLGSWEVSWSKVTKVDPSFSQSSNPKPIDSIKPKHKSTTPAGQYSNPKPFQASNPKPISNPNPNPKPSQTSAFGLSNTKPKALPASKPKPNLKPLYKWKPKCHRPCLTQFQTHPHSSQALPSHLFSSTSNYG